MVMQNMIFLSTNKLHANKQLELNSENWSLY